MIILIARCEVEPAALPALKPVLEQTMQATWEESDCLSYSIAVESEAAGVVTIVERWQSEAALRAYLASPAMRAFRAAIKDAIISLDTRIYDVTGERALPMPDGQGSDATAEPGLRLVTGGQV